MKMQGNGTRRNSIKLIYKAYIHTLLIIIFASVINVILDIIIGKEILFLPSIYLLVLPAFKFIQTSNFLELIPFAVFSTITVMIWYKCRNELFYPSDKSPKFIFISIFWYLLSTDFSIIASNLENTENLNAYNMIFCLVYLIFQIVVLYFKLMDYAKFIDERNQYKKLTANKIKREILKIRYTSVSNAMTLPFSFTLSAFVSCYILFYSGLVSIEVFTVIYIFLGICALCFTIDNFYQFNKFAKSTAVGFDKKLFKRKLIVCSISNLFIFAVSYVVICVLC